MIYQIRPAKGINEVNTHYLEVINARYQAEEYYRAGTNDTANVKMEVDESSGAVGGGVTANDPPHSKRMMIVNAIRAGGESQSDQGISRQELCKKFPHISDEMQSILDIMRYEGEIYETNPDHYLPCE